MRQPHEAFRDFTEQQIKLPWEIAIEGRTGVNIPDVDVPEVEMPAHLQGRELDIPSAGEQETERLFNVYDSLNYGISTNGIYTLGSCTMKLNPRVNEAIAALPGFTQTHPEQPAGQVQGNLKLMHELQDYLGEITGMDAVGLTPMAGAQSEFAGVLMIKAYHESNDEGGQRDTMLIPDSAHGTNPATAAMAGYKVQTIPSDKDGNIDLDAFEEALGPHIAGIMTTIPSTLGLFDPNIETVTQMVHASGGLVYGDGANMNALLGRVRPGDLGVDVMHLNLHKTFSTPHGGGGPGSAPVCVKQDLANYLPGPVIEYDEMREMYVPATPEQSIGRMGEAYGNFGMYVRAYAYIRSLGAQGLRDISDQAVLNANYLRTKLADDKAFDLPYDRTCMHEFVVSLAKMKSDKIPKEIAKNFAKGLIEAGVHPPTTYFPLFVPEALMIEPTESETKARLDSFVAVMRGVANLMQYEPDSVIEAPHTTPVRRVDEALAIREPKITWKAAQAQA